MAEAPEDEVNPEADFREFLQQSQGANTNPEVQCKLALCYHTGHGVAVDIGRNTDTGTGIHTYISHVFIWYIQESN